MTRSSRRTRSSRDADFVTSPIPSVSSGWVPSQLERDRIAYRRRQTRRSVLIAAISTAVVAVVGGAVVLSAPGGRG
jgi:polar amino acid transport system permease protein